MEKIGKYKILGKIGEGAMGVVYKALDPFIERVVALKTMSADMDAEPELRTRFHREARSAGQLSHKNIITIYELFEEGGRIYMAMEFLDGEDLKTRIARRDRIPLENRLQIMAEICEGLGHAHHKGIIHRDVKPGNIHLTRSGQVKILDFGLARIATSDITKTGSVMGTPNYMSPEQVRGDRVDHRSDVFSAGAVFYELLTFRKPFHGASYPETFFKILDREPEPPHAIDASIPEELSAIVLRALAKDPDQRFQSVDELLRELESFRAALEVRKRNVQDEAKRAVEELDRLIEGNLTVLRDQIETREGDETAPMLLAKLGQSSEDEEATKRLDFALGYFDLLEMRDRARREHEKITALLRSVEKAPAVIEEASSLRDAGELPRALQVLERFLSEVPVHRGARALAEQIREQLAEQAREEEKRRELARLLGEAEQLYRKRDWDESLRAAERVLALDPGSENALALRRKIEARLEEKRKEEERILRAEELFRDAAGRFARGDFAGCLTQVVEVLKLAPDHLEATALQEKAQQQIRELAELEEKKREARGALHAGSAALEAGDLERARQEIERARALDPELSGIHDIEVRIDREREIARLLAEARELDGAGKEEEALRRLAGVAEIDPEQPAAAALRREIDERRRARERAERERKEAIAAKARQAEQERRSGRLERAIELGREVLALEPGHAGAAALVRGAEEELRARKEREALEKKAKEIVAKSNALAARQDYRGALEKLEKLEKGIAALPLVREARAEYERELARQEEERERARRVAEHLERGKKAFGAADFAAAIEELGKLLALAPDHREAAGLRDRAAKGLEAQRERERRARELAQALRAASEALSRDELDAAARQATKARALAPEAPEPARIEAAVEKRRAELREMQLRRDRAEKLAAQAQEKLRAKDVAGAERALEEALTSWPELPGAARLQKKVRRAAARTEGRTAQILVAAAAGALVLAGVAWLGLRDGPQPEAPSPEGETALTEAAPPPDPAPDPTDPLEAARLSMAGKDWEAAVREAEAVLARSPDSSAARSLAEEARTRLAEIDQGVARVEALIAANDLEKASQTLGEVLELAPSSARVQELLGQLNEYFKTRADAAREQMNAAKGAAASARAEELAGATLSEAQGIETEAQSLYGQQKYGEAAGRFVAASDRFGRAEREARDAAGRAERERRAAALREAAQKAEASYRERRAAAESAQANALAADGFREAVGLAEQARGKLEAGDFEGAQRDFESAARAMDTSLSAAGAARGALEQQVHAARQEMERAKQNAPDTGAARSQEESAVSLEQRGQLAEAAEAFRRAAQVYQQARQQQAEREAILSVLASYEAAVETRDMEALKKVWPSIVPEKERTYRDSFRFARSWDVEMEPTRFEISGTSAMVTCARRDRMVTVEGQRYTPETNPTFLLEKSGSSWIIKDLRD